MTNRQPALQSGLAIEVLRSRKTRLRTDGGGEVSCLRFSPSPGTHPTEPKETAMNDYGYPDRQRFLRGEPAGQGDTVNGYLIAACLGAALVLALLGGRYA